MGLTIYYSGTLKEEASIDELIEEVRDICKVLSWEYHEINNEQLKGISYLAPECEPVFLTFNHERALCSPVLLKYDIQPPTQIFTKTQYAGMDVHKSIINIFRHLNEKYFSVFEMMDESGYWETGDEKIMEDQFDRYNTLLGMVSSVLKNFNKKEGESETATAERLQKLLQEKFKGREDELYSQFEIIKLTNDPEDSPGIK